MHLSQPLRHPLHHPQTSVHHSSPPSLFDTCPPHHSNNDKCHRFDLVRISSHCLANYSILFASFSASIRAPICRIWFSGCGDIDILVFEADGILIRPYLLIRGTSSLHSFIIGKAFSSLSTVPNIVPIRHHIARQSLHHRTTPLYPYPDTTHDTVSSILGLFLHHIHPYLYFESPISIYHPHHYHRCNNI
jgi:hypothetical protein